jgi:hypothetical protein
MLTLNTLVAVGVLSPAHPDLATRSPRIPGPPHVRAALGYLSANCGHCHNERSSVATVSYPLLMPAAESASTGTMSLANRAGRPAECGDVTVEHATAPNP